MNYHDLIVKALKGRSVNAAAKAWGVPQPTLDSYVKGKTMPDFDVADRIIKDADIDPVEGFKTLVDQARINKASRFKLQRGFVQTDLLLIAGTGGLSLILSILCKTEDGSEITIYIVYSITRNHPARHVDQTHST